MLEAKSQLIFGSCSGGSMKTTQNTLDGHVGDHSDGLLGRAATFMYRTAASERLLFENLAKLQSSQLLAIDKMAAKVIGCLLFYCHNEVERRYRHRAAGIDRDRVPRKFQRELRNRLPLQK